MERTISATDAARQLGVSRQRVHQLVRSGRIRAVGWAAGGRRMLIAADVESIASAPKSAGGRPQKKQPNTGE